MEPQEEKKKIKKKFLIIVFVIFISFLLLILYSRFIATTGVIVKEYKVNNHKLPSSFYGFKVVHFSDIHYGRTINQEELKNVVDKINALKPDIVVFTGDLFDNEKTLSEKDITFITKQFSKIQASIGKYSILGEDDYDKKEWLDIMQNSSFVHLNNNYELIYKDGYEPILLAGIDTNLKGTKNITEKISLIENYIHSEEVNIPNYKILLMHEPDYVNKISYKNYDLILAGHSHNGQVRFPLLGAIIKPVAASHYYDEFYALGNTNFYISSGLGTTKYDFRLWNRPSINLYRLVNK